MKSSWWARNINIEDWGNLETVLSEFFSDLPMTQGALAEQLGVDQTAVSRWAKGRTKPTRDEFVQSVELVDQRVKELVKRVEEARRLVEVIQSMRESNWGKWKNYGEARRELHELLEALSKRKKPNRKQRNTKSR